MKQQEDSTPGYIELLDGILPNENGVNELKIEQHGVNKK